MKILEHPADDFFSATTIRIQNQEAIVTNPANALDWIRDELKKNKAILKEIILTHGDLAHAARAAELSSEVGVGVAAPHEILVELNDLPRQAEARGMCGVKVPQIARFVEPNEEV